METSDISFLRQIALLRAKQRERKKKEEEDALKEFLLSSIPMPSDGKDGERGRDGVNGKDAPSLETILESVKPLLPEPTIIQTKEQVIQEIDEGLVRRLIKEELPEPKTPEIQVIEKEIDFNKDEFVTQEEMKNILKRIDQAIVNNRGGGGLAAKVQNDIDTKLEVFVDELTELVKGIAKDTSSLESLSKLEAMFEGVVCAIQDNKTQLELLNARTEEALETEIYEEDLD
jgi:hypothetical protein